MDFFISLERSGLATWVRESGSLFGYAGFLTLHTVGLAMLVGANTFVDLRLLGVGDRLPLARLRGFFPMMWAGFAVNAVSGVVLFMTDATRKATQPVFGIKLLLIAAGLVIIARTKVAIDNDVSAAGTPSGTARLLAILSLLVWIGAITAGRLMAYLNTAPPTVF